MGSFRLGAGRAMDVAVTHGTARPTAVRPTRRPAATPPLTSQPTRRRSTAKTDPVKSAIGLAEGYIRADLPQKAREVLADALEANPGSAWAAKARRMLANLQ